MRKRSDDLVWRLSMKLGVDVDVLHANATANDVRSQSSRAVGSKLDVRIADRLCVAAHDPCPFLLVDLPEQNVKGYPNASKPGEKNGHGLFP